MRPNYVAVSGIPQSIAHGIAAYWPAFCQDTGFEHVSRYVTGLLLSANKTLQGIYSQWVFPAGPAVSRRAMHEAVFVANRRLALGGLQQVEGGEVGQVDALVKDKRGFHAAVGKKDVIGELGEGVGVVRH